MALCSRRYSIVVAVISFISALFTTVASVVATVLYSIFRNVFVNAEELNVKAHLGSRMYALVWLASGFSLAAFAFHTSLCWKKVRGIKQM